MSVRRFAWLMLLCSCFAAAEDELPSDSTIRERMREQRPEILRALDEATVATPQSRAVVSLPDVSRLKPESLDLEKFIKDFNAAKEAGQSGGGATVLVFVSFSMPDSVLRKYSEQAKEVGAVLMLRGMKEGSLKKTAAHAGEINKGIGAAWEIHPEAFKRFKVDAVPTIVVATNSAGPVSEDGCAPEGEYASVAGDVSIVRALDIIRQRAEGKVASIAESKLRETSERARGE